MGDLLSSEGYKTEGGSLFSIYRCSAITRERVCVMPVLWEESSCSEGLQMEQMVWRF